MKSKYCFLRTSGHLKPGDVIYQVWVGSFLREFTKLTLVQEYCKDCGLYLEKWSPLVDSHLDEMKSRYSGGASVISSPFVTASISISKLYAMIIDDSFESFEYDLLMSQSEKWCRFHSTIRYHKDYHGSIVLRNAYPPRRKNLSLNNRNEGFKAACCFIGILILIALDILMTNIMNW